MGSVVDKCKNDPQEAFNLLVQNRFSALSSEPLVVLALSIWYEGFIPDISKLVGREQVTKAGYIIERLLAFHCVTSSTRVAIKPIVDRLIEISTDHIDILPVETILKQPQFSGDGLAKRWRLNEDLHLCMQALLPYQTRIYAQGRRSI